MNWLITGGSGYIAKFLIQKIQLKFPDDTIHIFDIFEPSLPLNDKLQFHSLNILDTEHLKLLLASIKPDNIIHLAATFNTDNPLKMVKLNVEVCGEILNCIVENNIQVNSIVVVGSSAQYSNISENGPYPSESTECNPRSLYGYTKTLQEFIALDFISKYQLPIIIVRPANIIGPGQSINFVVPKILDQLIKISENKAHDKNELHLFHMNSSRDFIDVRDVCDALVLLIEEKKALGEKFNLGTNQSQSLASIIDLTKSILKIDQLTVIQEKPNSAYDFHLTDSQKVRDLLHWKPKISISESLNDMILSLENNKM